MQTTYIQKNNKATHANKNDVYSVNDHSAQASCLQRKNDFINKASQRKATPHFIQRAKNPVQHPNNTGLPDNLKNGVERLSGYSLDNVRVHYNSPKPATVQALAYTQGTDIHVASGQEHVLPHEAWHVTQQMAGRVTPTINVNGTPVNDNAELEHEADIMGEKAVQCKKMGGGCKKNTNQPCCQRALTFKGVFDKTTKQKLQDFTAIWLSDLLNKPPSDYKMSRSFAGGSPLELLETIRELVNKNDIDDFILDDTNDNTLAKIKMHVERIIAQKKPEQTLEVIVMSDTEIQHYGITFKIDVSKTYTERIDKYKNALKNGIAKSAKNATGIKYLNVAKTLFELKVGNSNYRLVGKREGDQVNFDTEKDHTNVNLWIRQNS